MKRDLGAAIAFLFPNKVEAIREKLAPLPNDRVRWAVLACSRGNEADLEKHLKWALADWRDVLQSESLSDDPKGNLLRRLPWPEQLALQLHARELERLAFFDRAVWSGAMVFDPTRDLSDVVRALTDRMAPGYGAFPWLPAAIERARFLLLHVLQRSFSPDEVARAPELLREFESVARIERAFASCDPDPPPVLPDGRHDRASGRPNYRIGVVLLGQARAWGLWMVHQSG